MQQTFGENLQTMTEMLSLICNCSVRSSLEIWMIKMSATDPCLAYFGTGAQVAGPQPV